MCEIWRVALPEPRISIATASGGIATGWNRCRATAQQNASSAWPVDLEGRVARQVQRARQPAPDVRPPSHLPARTGRRHGRVARDRDDRDLALAEIERRRPVDPHDPEREMVPAGACRRHLVPLAGPQEQAHETLTSWRSARRGIASEHGIRCATWAPARFASSTPARKPMPRAIA